LAERYHRVFALHSDSHARLAFSPGMGVGACGSRIGRAPKTTGAFRRYKSRGDSNGLKRHWPGRRAGLTFETSARRQISQTIGIRYPTECLGPPHLLGPWGSAGPEAETSGLLMPLPAGHHSQPPTRHPEVRAKRASKGDGPGAPAVILRGAQERAPQDDG
jgi:hypothetical protein